MRFEVTRLDRNESKQKLEELKQLVDEGKLEEAAEYADDINWKKVKNINLMVKAGEVYTECERFDDAREILLMAYDRSPIGRMIIYRLAEIAIRTKNVEEALEYYDEFVDIAPHDSRKYVLRYEILQMQGASLEEKIQLLEEMKEAEYTEKWAFELAYLYHKANMTEQCIEACDELVLWFGDGPYVEKALELKMLYQPLNKIQEQKYRDFHMKKQGINPAETVEVRPHEKLESGEIINETMRIPDINFNTGKFNTVNLQKELAKSMQQIAEATEKGEINDTMDNIKKMVEEIPYLQITKEEEPEQDISMVTDEEIDSNINEQFQEYLAENQDGQMSLLVPEGTPTVPQITGQISIDEILAEWERTKRAAEAAMADAEQKKLENAKAKALQEAEDIMERLAGVIPQLNAGLTPHELLEQEYTKNLTELSKKDEKAAGEYVASVNDILQQEIERLTEHMAEEPTAGEPVSMAEALTSVETPMMETEMPKFAEEVEELQDSQEPEEPVVEAVYWSPQNLQELDMEEALKAPKKEIHPFVAPQITKEGVEIPFTPITMATADLPDVTEALDDLLKEEKKEEIPEINEVEVPEIELPPELTEEQRESLSYFADVRGLEEQLEKCVKNVAMHLQEDAHATRGNVLIQGAAGNGKTTLATNLIKAVQKEVGKPNQKFGKISAESLNNKDIPELLKHVAGGVLMIEEAGEISHEAAVRLSLCMESDNSGVLIMMEDTKRGLHRALSQDSSFAAKFTEKIVIPAFSSDELVAFGKTYALEQGYEIEEMAILALYDRISRIQRLDKDTTVVEVKDIVDEAIAKAERIGFRNLFTSRKTNGDYAVLREKDFA